MSSNQCRKISVRIVVSNGFHEDGQCLGKIRSSYAGYILILTAGVCCQSFFLSQIRALRDLRLENEVTELKPSGLHGLYKDGKDIGESDLPLKEESFGTKGIVHYWM